MVSNYKFNDDIFDSFLDNPLMFTWYIVVLNKILL